MLCRSINLDYKASVDFPDIKRRKNYLWVNVGQKATWSDSFLVRVNKIIWCAIVGQKSRSTHLMY